MKPAVGVIGLGIMGGAMAEALLAAGYKVCGYDPSSAAQRRFKKAGGKLLGSAAAVARNAKPSDIVQPGHVFPLRAQRGGVLMRAGHTEAGCDLAELAGLTPAAVICEILKEDGTMARLPDLIEFAQEHQLKIGTIADLIHYRSQNESIVERVAERRMQTPHGEFHDRIMERRINLVKIASCPG